MKTFVEDFANRQPYDYFPDNYNIWHIGFENTIEKGIKYLLQHLDKKGHIIVGDPELISQVWCTDVDNIPEIDYIILFQSLPKLEYLEYKYQEEK